VGLISAADMGRYVVALSLSRTLNSVYQAASAVLFPKCIGMTRRQAFTMTIRTTAATTALAVPGALLLCILGSSLLRLFYGSEYVIATTLLQLLTAEAILSGITTLMSQPFMAMGRPGTVTVLQAIGLAGTIPLLIVMVPKFGTVGAGIALLSTAVLRLTLLLGCYVGLAKRLPQRRDLKLLIGSLPKSVQSRLAALGDRKFESVR
jgi:O-antigen/teichoic acid export membrane protein